MSKGAVIKKSYMGNVLRTYPGLHLFSVILVGGMQFLILMLVITANLLEMFQAFYKQLPPLAQHLFGEDFARQFTVVGAASFGYSHPVVLTICMLVAILLPARFIAGEIETGRMEILLALPIRRRTVFLSLCFAIGLIHLTIVTGGWCGTFLAKVFFPEAAEIPVAGVLRVGLNLWFLTLCVSSYTLLISAVSREYGRAALLSAAITVGLFFLNYITKIWDAIQFIAPVNIISYFSTKDSMSSPSVFLKNILVLAALTILFAALACRKFKTRDIPG
jgi:ABC-2 type transport system permease protein